MTIIIFTIYIALYTRLQQIQLFSLGCNIHNSTYLTLTLTLTIMLTPPTLLLSSGAYFLPRWCELLGGRPPPNPLEMCALQIVLAMFDI